MAAAGMKSVYDTLQALDKGMAGSKVDLAKTFDPRFVIKASQTVKEQPSRGSGCENGGAASTAPFRWPSVRANTGP